MGRLALDAESALRRLHRGCFLSGAVVLALTAFVPASAGASRPAAAAKSQQAAEALLERAMASGEFRPKLLGPVTWIEGGKWYLTLEPSSAGDATRDIVRYDTVTGKRDIFLEASRLIPLGRKAPLRIEEFSLSPDSRRILIFTDSQRVWRQNTRGDYWVFDRDSGSLHHVGGDAPPASLMFAKFSPDGSRVAYVRDHDIYVEDLASAAVTQVTHDGSPTIINGTSDWVNEEELDIRDGFRWSPDSRRIAFWQFDTSGVGQYTLIYDLGNPRGKIVTGIPYPQYGIYPQSLIYPYPEAGATNSAVRVGVAGAEGGPVVWMRVPGDPRNHYIAQIDWAGPGQVELQQLNRLQNTNRIFLADAGTGEAHQIFEDQDNTWVNFNHTVTWIDGGKEFLFLSERDFWRHLYRVPLDGSPAQLVTHGAFDVVALDAACPAGDWVYFTASPDNATQRYLYRTRLDGSGAAQRVTPNQAGTHGYEISPDCGYAIHSFSSIDTPPSFALVRLPDHQLVRTLVNNDSLADRVRQLSGGPTEFLRLDAGSGITVDAWLMKPPHFDAAKKYPLIVDVYSEPAGQTTADRWGSPFDRVLTSAGYLVASFDNQGTPSPLGAAWRHAIYGSIGPLSSAEQAAALQSLERSLPFIDPHRIGVWGWSGGGSETLELMFRYPDVYHVGVSVASVPDQRLYDSIYQERYMGLPQDNPKGYRDGSAINFASGLRGPLLVMHGSGDDNVHFQGFELLVNRLIELGKRFDMRVYPGRTHGLTEGPGTRLDVYKNILWYFEDHLPAGPQPPAN